MTAEPEDTLSQALACARHGWPVFPCRPGGKQPATRHGFRDATTDPDLITWWWQRQPAANLAIATGLPGPDILDVDQRGPAGNGFTACRQLQRAGLLGGPSAIVATPGGGLHAYFAGSAQPSGRLPRHHLDFKASGGYVLAPPSQVRGRPYRLIARPAGSAGLDWAVVTALLDPRRHQMALPERPGHADVSRLAGWVEKLQPGNRNAGLFWAACRALETGQPASLDDLAAAAARTGLSHREITRTITSARQASQHVPGRQPGTAADRQPDREATR